MRSCLAVIISTTRGSFGAYATAALQDIMAAIEVVRGHNFNNEVVRGKSIVLIRVKGAGSTLRMAQTKGRAFKVRATAGGNMIFVYTQSAYASWRAHANCGIPYAVSPPYRDSQKCA